MGDLLPVIVADLSDANARAFLEDVASRGGECWVPLVDAPSDASNHLLEVYTPGASEPLRLLAEPLGQPSDKGFPLRLMPFESAESKEVVAIAQEIGTADTLQRVEVGSARRSAPTPISAEHAAHLAGQAPPTPQGLIGRRLAGGKLEIEELIGQGMMGAVYKARHRELGMTIAVKVLRDTYQRDVEFARRFYAEALAVSRLDHPNLVRVLDFGQEPDGLLYLAMEYLHGRSLRAIELHEGPMPVRRIVDIMTQICAGLGHAHSKGILHRDVKPDNVVLVRGHDDDGRETDLVKVLDFGLALLRQEDAQRERFAGTPVYMAPEQCRGDELDARADVYACGIMLFEMATGTVPFLSDNPMIVVNRHLSMAPPPMASMKPDIDPRLDWIVQRALKKSRNERYADMRELRADLKELLRPVSIMEVDEPPPNSIPAPAALFEEARGPSFSIPPPAEPREKAPSWLEEGSLANQRFLEGMTTGDVTANMLATDPAQWLRRLAQEEDLLSFEKLLAELDAAIRAMAKRGEARGMWSASNALHGIAGEGSHRSAHAAALLRTFADPNLLSPIAEILIAPSTDAETRTAAHSLVRAAGVAGAYAMYGARVRLAAEPRVRAPFVTVMKELGEQAWPVVRAALERIPDAALSGAHPVAADLAEDILAAAPAPAVRDESAGLLVQKYVRAKVPSLCRAATGAVARLWQERARPLLIALLEEEDDGVRAAAITGLCQIGAIDEAVVRRLAAIVSRAVPTGHELRGIAVQALARTDADAQNLAVPILAEVVRDPAGEDATVLFAARSLAHLAGDSAKAWISERAERSPDPLRSHLHAIVQGAG